MNAIVRSALRFVGLPLGLLGLVCNASVAAAPLRILTSSDDHTLREFTAEGELVATVEIPANLECCGYPRDLVVTDQGEVVIYNGTFDPDLSRYDPRTHSWSHDDLPDWGTVNNLSYGGIAAKGAFVYVTDMYTGFDTTRSQGIVRFDLETGESTRFLEQFQYIDLNLGGDGRLYALRSAYGPLDIVDPTTMGIARTLDLAHKTDARATAANAAGEIFIAGYDGTLSHFDSHGNRLARRQVGISHLVDLDLDASGRLAAANRFGEVVLTDQTLADPQVFDVAGPQGPNSFVALASEPVLSSPSTRPWHDNARGQILSDAAWHYALGYHFTPLRPGEITELGGYFNGTKRVRLYEAMSGLLLAETTVTAENDWAYLPIKPVIVEAGVRYTVAVYIAGSGGSYQYGIDPFPLETQNVRIEGSTYAYTGADPDAQPTLTWRYGMYGQADVVFRPIP